jgi:tRNA (guanine37-N1)-methyltransferase
MKFDIITIFPNFFDFFLNNSIIKKAYQKKKIIVDIFDLRKYSQKKHNQIDDIPFSGGVGMLLTFPPFYECLKQIKKDIKSRVILFSPQGKILNQKIVFRYAQKFSQLIFLCGNYEGIDARILDYVDEELSLGDYILTGGEIAAIVVIDAITRVLPGVINPESCLKDSFQNDLLKYPEYTRPQEYKGHKVPDILLSGNHQKIEEWKIKESLRSTFLKRPDLIKIEKLNTKMKKLLEEIKKEENILN